MVNKIVIECPKFDDIDYTFQKEKMEGNLEYCGYNVEKAYKTPYTTPDNGSSIVDEIKVHEVNNKTKFIFKNSLSHSKLIEVVNLKTAKEVWDALENIHEGDEKVKEAKLQNLEAQFEIL